MIWFMQRGGVMEYTYLFISLASGFFGKLQTKTYLNYPLSVAIPIPTACPYGLRTSQEGLD